MEEMEFLKFGRDVKNRLKYLFMHKIIHFQKCCTLISTQLLKLLNNSYKL